MVPRRGGGPIPGSPTGWMTSMARISDPTTIVIPTLYRFMEPKYALSAVELGELYIGTLAACASIEDGLSDPNEGLARVVAAPFSVDQGPQRQSRIETLSKFGVRIEGDCNVHFGATTLETRVQGLVLCMTDSHDNAHVREVAPEKSAVVRIEDPVGLSWAITEAIAKQLKLTELRWAGDKVRYAPRIHEDIDLASGSSPFVKEPHFAGEREWRSFWHIRDADPMIVRSEEIRSFLTLIAD